MASGPNIKNDPVALLRDMMDRQNILEKRVGGGSVPRRLSARGSEIVSDANDAIENGWYVVFGGTANAPSASGVWFIDVRAFWADADTPPDGAYVEQIATRVDNANLKYRRMRLGSSNVWTGWTLVFETLAGPAADRAATISNYWQEWQDTDSSARLYLGNKSGGWRQKNGIATAATAAWDNTSSGAGTPVASAIGARTISFVLPTILETNEYIGFQAVTVGTGFGFVGGSGLTRGGSNTTLSVRFMQVLSTTTQALTIAWWIVQS